MDIFSIVLAFLLLCVGSAGFLFYRDAKINLGLTVLVEVVTSRLLYEIAVPENKNLVSMIAIALLIGTLLSEVLKKEVKKLPRS